jgi:hypothetical protein
MRFILSFKEKVFGFRDFLSHLLWQTIDYILDKILK